MKTNLFLIIFILSLTTSCVNPNKDFKCLKLTDINGSPTGTHGNCDNDADWRSIDLSDKEKEYLDFEIASDVTGAVAQSTEGVIAYPNPAAINETIFFSPIFEEDAKTSVLRLAIVNSKDDVLFTASQLVEKGDTIAIAMSDSVYETGLHYRLFYQLEDEAGTVFYEGFGDLLLCDAYPIEDISSCYD